MHVHLIYLVVKSNGGDWVLETHPNTLAKVVKGKISF